MVCGDDTVINVFYASRSEKEAQKALVTWPVCLSGRLWAFMGVLLGLAGRVAAKQGCLPHWLCLCRRDGCRNGIAITSEHRSAYRIHGTYDVGLFLGRHVDCRQLSGSCFR